MRNIRWEQANQIAEDPYRRPDGGMGRLEAWCQETPHSFFISMIITLVFTLLFAFAGAMVIGPGKAPVPSISVEQVVLSDNISDLTDLASEADSSTAQTVDSSPNEKFTEIDKPDVVDDLGNIPDLNTTINIDSSKAQTQSNRVEQALAGLQIKAKPGPSSRPGGGGAPISGFFKELAKDKKSLVFVIDKSGSMSGRPLQRVKAELIFAIDSLKEDQRFSVIFFDDVAWPILADRGHSALSNLQPLKMLAGVEADKQKARTWINKMYGSGGTNPGGAMLMALDVNPEYIVLLSDGEFSQIYVAEIRNKNTSGTVVDCVGLSETIRTLQDVASQNGGVYYQAK